MNTDFQITGEETQAEKLGKYAVVGALGIGWLLTMIFLFINFTLTHLITFIVLTVMLALTLIIAQWYRKEELDEKFKYIIAAMMVNFIILLIASNVYYFYTPPDAFADCPNGMKPANPDYPFGTCFLICPPGLCLDQNVITPEGSGLCRECIIETTSTVASTTRPRYEGED
eukprot:Lithocolla_globosa_v1_NODE_7994_length_876_cov_20.676005.p1 type:complete len:171 gc:universal NODE_7994_length_876_cov_20.676005:613-101(-)